MSRYRLYPTPAQETILREHCGHARYIWNLCIEQNSWWRPGRGNAPGRAERQRQLTEARAEFNWLRCGSIIIQQNALRDFTEAMDKFFRGTHGKPTWRKARRKEGFRVVGTIGLHWDVRRLSRKTGEVRIPKLGWVRFRWSHTVPAAKSFRVTLDRSGRWHVGFAAYPAPVTPPPGTGEVVGVDRGVTISAALSTGELLNCPGLRDTERTRLVRLERRAARRQVRGQPPSGRLERNRTAIARLMARAADRRKDWCEKTSTDIARRFDVIRIEDLEIAKMTRSVTGKNMRQKAGLNRGILASGWGMLARRLGDKAPGRVQKIRPHYTSLTCNACGHCEEGNRKSQAFLCLRCGHSDHADVNAAKNIAGGYPVTARGGSQLGSVKREPQRAA